MPSFHMQGPSHHPSQVRSVCVILDSFHFTTPREWALREATQGGIPNIAGTAPPALAAASAPAPASNDNQEDEEGDDGHDAVEGAASAGAPRGVVDPAMEAADIRLVLHGRVLPCLHSHLVEDDEEVGVGIWARL